MDARLRYIRGGGEYNMIPILYDNSKTLNTIVTDRTNGLGKLSEVISCTVVEERNGQYDMTFTIPITAKHFADIKNGYIVKVKAADSVQLFRIYKINKEMNGLVMVDCHHITYDMAKAPVKPFTSQGATTTVRALKNNLMTTYPFTIQTDISNTTSRFTLDVPRSFRECLGGYEGSILDVFGGEYQWDNTTIKLLASRGSDNGVRIAYGKNLVDLNQEENIENTYDGVVGFATYNEQTTTGAIQYATTQRTNPRVKIVDFSSDFSDTNTPTVAKLNTKAQAYIQANNVGVPKVSIDVDFVDLSKTQEYQDIAPLEKVSLCDVVTVDFPKLGVSAQSKVIRTEWNVLAERYDKIELGDARSSLMDVIDGTIEQATENMVTSSIMDSAINHATDMISGGLGGFVVIGRNANGEPEEILIMDTNDKQTAQNVIRLNKNGIGFSTTGYDGTYRNAWTINGQFVADNITGGVMRAGSIEGVDISGSTITFDPDRNPVVAKGSGLGTDGGVIFEGQGDFTVTTNTIGLNARGDSVSSFQIQLAGSDGNGMHSNSLLFYDNEINMYHADGNDTARGALRLLDGDTILSHNDSSGVNRSRVTLQDTTSGLYNYQSDGSYASYISINSDGFFLSDNANNTNINSSSQYGLAISINGATMTNLEWLWISGVGWVLGKSA